MTRDGEVELQYGLPFGDGRERLVRLREPNGHDEAMVVAMAGEPPGLLASRLVHALIDGAGDTARPSPEDVCGLTVGDRERILFHVAAGLIGAQADMLAACPACHELSEIDLRFADLADVDPVPAAGEVALAADDGEWRAEVRPVTCADVDRALGLADGQARSLLTGCLLRLTDPAGEPADTEDLPAACEAPLAQALRVLDPAAERRLAIGCPACGTGFDALADGFTIVRAGFASPERFYDTVYRMARSYHWSEAEILALPLSRRRHYLAVAESAEAIA